MSKIAKVIIVILALLLVGSVFFALFALSQKTVAEREKISLEEEIKKYKESGEKLGQQNKKIAEELEDAKSAKDKLQKQLTELENQTSALSSEKDNWKTRVDDVKQERNQLVAKIEDLEKELKEAKEAAQKVVTVQPPLFSPPPQTVSVSTPAPTGQQDEYWAEILKERASLEVTVNDLKQRLSTGLTEAEELKKKNSELETALGQLKNEKEEIERKIKYNDNLADTLSTQLYKEKDEKKSISEKFDKAKEEILALHTQVKELSESKAMLEQGIAKLTDDKAVVEKKLTETESTLHERTHEVLGIKESIEKDFQSLSISANKKEVELAPIVVRAVGSVETREKKPKAPVIPEVSQNQIEKKEVKKTKKDSVKEVQDVNKVEPPQNKKEEQSITKNTDQPTEGIKGSVLSVNPKDSFVIINLGEDSGLKAGDTLGVYRGKERITDLGVIQVRKNVSAADIKEKGAKIQVGDIVK